MEEYDYEAAAGTIEMEDITSDLINQEILRRLKKNDPNFVKVMVKHTEGRGEKDGRYWYCPEGARDLGWLGYFIGNNTQLEIFLLHSDLFEDFINGLKAFFRGVNRNRSIQRILLNRTDLSGGELFESLHPFFEKNKNLCALGVLDHCVFGNGCARQLSLALFRIKSLTTFVLRNSDLGGEGLVEIIEALSTHPQLQKLALTRMNIGRDECNALSNLLSATAQIQSLNLSRNAIDDEGVDALMDALTHITLCYLDLDSNPNITARGCQRLASLLEYPNSNLEVLRLNGNGVGDEGAHIFANALATNCKLKTLDLYNNGITAQGWSYFSKVLYDTSSINKTFLSNHTLESLSYMAGMHPTGMPVDVVSLLTLNCSSEDKKEVAIKKILKHHHFDMQPFFEWDLKVLPLAVNWFDGARTIENTDEAVIGRQKLGAIFQFIRAMPEIFEPAPAAGDKRSEQLMGILESLIIGFV